MVSICSVNIVSANSKNVIPPITTNSINHFVIFFLQSMEFIISSASAKSISLSVKYRYDFFPFDHASLFSSLNVSAINPCVKKE